MSDAIADKDWDIRAKGRAWLEDDNVEWIVHKILLQKDNSLSCYKVHFEGDDFSTVKEVIIAPGKYK